LPGDDDRKQIRDQTKKLSMKSASHAPKHASIRDCLHEPLCVQARILITKSDNVEKNNAQQKSQ